MLSSLHGLPLLLPVWPSVLAIPGFYLKLFYEFDPFCLGVVQLASGRSVFPPVCVCSMCTLCQGASLQLQETQVTKRDLFYCVLKSRVLSKIQKYSDVFFLPQQKSHCTESPKSNVRGTQTSAEIVDPLPENQEH